MKRTKTKILSVFLSFCMIISCMVGMSVTALAAEMQWDSDNAIYTLTGGVCNTTYGPSSGLGYYQIPLEEQKVLAITTINVWVKITGNPTWGLIQVCKNDNNLIKQSTFSNVKKGMHKYTFDYEQGTSAEGSGIYAQVLLGGGDNEKYGELLAYEISFSGSLETVKEGDLNYPEFDIPNALPATVGQTLAEVDLPTATNGTWSWADSTASVGDAGTHTFKANFTPTDTNYSTISNIDVTVTVAPAQQWESGDCLVKLDGTTITVTKKEGNGDGKMADYTNNERAPWDSVIQNTVQTIDIKEGVTYISAYAFYMHSATTINIPSTVTHIGACGLDPGSNTRNHTVCFTRPTDEGSLQLGANAFYDVQTALKYSGEGRFVLFDGDKELEEGESIISGEGKTLTWKIPTYSITATSENGTVAATVGDSTSAVTKAQVGDTVTLTVTPASGYAFKSITASTPKDSPESFSDLVALMGTTVFNGSGYNTGDSCICKVENGKFVVYNNSSTNVAEATASNVTNFSASAGIVYSWRKAENEDHSAAPVLSLPYLRAYGDRSRHSG